MDSLQEKTIEYVRQLAWPILEDQGLELVDVQFRREPAGWVLRLFVDRVPPPGASGIGDGVTLDEITDFSRELGRVLDVEDAVEGPYTLEVSSPGLDRLLSKPSDFERFAGFLVRMKAVGAEGPRKMKGRLLGLVQDEILIEVDGREVKTPFEEVQWVRLSPEIDWSRV